MSEWGTPDWRDASAYGDTSTWSLPRWRWEFFRRREDVRAFFDGRCADTYQGELRYWQYAQTNLALASHYASPPLHPNDPGFVVRCTIEEAATFGLNGIPNPRIGEQPWHIISPNRTDGIEGMVWVRKGEESSSLGIKPHQIGFAFALNKPIAAQLAQAKVLLLEMQAEKYGKPLQVRKHQMKWLGYLRALDAREANATWEGIASLVPHTAQTEHSGRDTWEQARALCFNF